MLYTALQLMGPVLLRYPRGRSDGFVLPERPILLPVGRAEWLKQGTELVFLAVGTMVQTAQKAAEALEKCGISTGVVNIRFVKPLDQQVVETVAQTARWIVTMEENSLLGGFGSAVLEAINNAGQLGPRILRLGLPDCFVEQGSREELLNCLRLDPAGVIAQVKAFIEEPSDAAATA